MLEGVHAAATRVHATTRPGIERDMERTSDRRAEMVSARASSPAPKIARVSRCGTDRRARVQAHVTLGARELVPGRGGPDGLVRSVVLLYEGRALHEALHAARELRAVVARDGGRDGGRFEIARVKVLPTRDAVDVASRRGLLGRPRRSERLALTLRQLGLSFHAAPSIRELFGRWGYEPGRARREAPSGTDPARVLPDVGAAAPDDRRSTHRLPWRGARRCAGVSRQCGPCARGFDATGRRTDVRERRSGARDRERICPARAAAGHRARLERSG